MKEFYINEFHVDMYRSQIRVDGKVHSVEPKVLQVLALLAEHQGEVVTHEQFLAQIWPNMVVGPNAIQRCIAQLRKVLNDDVKTQALIMTHPKIGYSLIPSVQWTKRAVKNDLLMNACPSKQALSESTAGSSFKKWGLGVAILLVVSLLTWQLMPPMNNAERVLRINKLEAITATDYREIKPSFSPDGRYIIFQRHLGGCQNELWAKDRKTNREYRLTKEVGYYGAPSWSPDGQQVVFSSVAACQQTQQLTGCSELRALSFSVAKTQAQQSRRLLACDGNDYDSPVWIADDKIAFINRGTEEEHVGILSLKDNKVSVLYKPEDKTLYFLDYGYMQNKIAISERDAINRFSLVTIDMETQAQNRIELEPNPQHKYAKFWQLSWHPSEESLITAANNGLYKVDMKGRFHAYTLPMAEHIYTPKFHPNGHTLVASMGAFDYDLGFGNIHHSEPTSFARSTQNEFSAKLQPNGEHIAFISDRSGSRQVWLAAKERASDVMPLQLSQFTKNHYLQDFVWSQNASVIIAAAGHSLHLLDLNGEHTSIATPFEIVDVYQALSENRVLLKAVVNDAFKLVLYDYSSHEYSLFTANKVNSARVGSQKQLYILNENGNIYVNHGSDLSSLIDTATLGLNQLLDVQGELIFAASRNGKIWQVNMQTQVKTVLYEGPRNIDIFSDFNPKTGDVLFSHLASSKNEIVVLE
ncbi:winged helix-turn-helix domain-containing protein [Pseudoalteromonas luteoviolacea]|uniref:winged helix-turn-helix domain-containing protein n=1 Tax=Pseudoalteromonas luteoviolacea TaxID=43657 RepID=UPI001EEDD7C5|nr:winged helix-turn-helix domain-containing protein [Pseudoalteromonas luteoviolacea]MCF6442880.1 winged helix-turn-helix domain-containing protein [Pseudoalteromonas luteoviolacea]